MNPIIYETDETEVCDVCGKLHGHSPIEQLTCLRAGIEVESDYINEFRALSPEDRDELLLRQNMLIFSNMNAMHNDMHQVLEAIGAEEVDADDELEGEIEDTEEEEDESFFDDDEEE